MQIFGWQIISMAVSTVCACPRDGGNHWKLPDCEPCSDKADIPCTTLNACPLDARRAADLWPSPPDDVRVSVTSHVTSDRCRGALRVSIQPPHDASVSALVGFEVKLLGASTCTEGKRDCVTLQLDTANVTWTSFLLADTVEFTYNCFVNLFPGEYFLQVYSLPKPDPSLGGRAQPVLKKLVVPRFINVKDKCRDAEASRVTAPPLLRRLTREPFFTRRDSEVVTTSPDTRQANQVVFLAVLAALLLLLLGVLVVVLAYKAVGYYRPESFAYGTVSRSSSCHSKVSSIKFYRERPTFQMKDARSSTTPSELGDHAASTTTTITTGSC